MKITDIIKNNMEAVDAVKKIFQGEPTEEQLKAFEKAYAAVRKMEPGICEPRYLGENTAIGYRIGECRCGTIVRSYHNYCSECGIGLEWGNVHE